MTFSPWKVGVADEAQEIIRDLDVCDHVVRGIEHALAIHGGGSEPVWRGAFERALAEIAEIAKDSIERPPCSDKGCGRAYSVADLAQLRIAEVGAALERLWGTLATDAFSRFGADWPDAAIGLLNEIGGDANLLAKRERGLPTLSAQLVTSAYASAAREARKGTIGDSALARLTASSSVRMGDSTIRKMRADAHDRGLRAYDLDAQLGELVGRYFRAKDRDALREPAPTDSGTVRKSTKRRTK